MRSYAVPCRPTASVAGPSQGLGGGRRALRQVGVPPRGREERKAGPMELLRRRRVALEDLLGCARLKVGVVERQLGRFSLFLTTSSVALLSPVY